MDTTAIHSRTSARERLLQCERSRCDPQYRDLFWDGGQRWCWCFDQLVQCEQASDVWFRDAIDEARLGSTTQWELEGEQFSMVAGDVAWYAQLWTQLHGTEQAWQQDSGVDASERSVLGVHMRLVEERLLQREIDQAQVALELLERHRVVQGGLRRGSWGARWEALREAFLRQNKFYAVHRLPMKALRERRLQWCESLYATQEATLRVWQAQGDVDRHGLRADMAYVGRQIKKLRPQWSVPLLWRRAVVAVVVLGVVLGLVLVQVRGAFGAPLPLRGVAQPVSMMAMPSVAQVPGLLREGEGLLREGDVDGAFVRFQQAFQVDPGGARAYEALNDMAFCVYEEGRVDEAIGYWGQAWRLKGDSPDVNAGLGMALFVRSRRAVGAGFYRRALLLSAGYADEGWMREERLWSERVLRDSRALRAVLVGSR